MSIILGDGAAVLIAEETARESGSRELALFRLRQIRKKRRQHYQRIAADNPLVFQPRTPRLPIQPPPAPPARKVNASLLRFLFEKELRNSDVSIAGRIVVPKKLAEMHLPLLNEKEGLWMHLDDMDLQQVWTFKFRFWPNHRSRMYVLENAKEFIKRHGLELGDYLMFFKDDQADSYVIRGRKKNGNSRAQTMNNNISNTNLPACEEYSSSFYYAENHQYDNHDGATPDYEQLISSPYCESLDLSPPIE